jgi:TatD DNase family protein
LFSESHCHLRSPIDDAIEQAKKVGVELVLNAGIDLTSSELAIQFARKYPIVRACAGIHPWNADQYSEQALHKLKEIATDAMVIAISEIGLDYTGRRTPEGQRVNEYIDKRIQRTVFREQLKLAKELNLPVLVHDRTPEYEVLDILEEVGNAKVGAVIHGFSRDLAYAKRCIDMGIYLSIGLRDITSLENATLKEAIKQIPLTLMLTETDSGNPEGVLTVANKIAELKNLSMDDVGRTATQNLKKLIRQSES